MYFKYTINFKRRFFSRQVSLPVMWRAVNRLQKNKWYYEISTIYWILKVVISRAGRVNGGTIVLSRERTERSRTIPSFRKKNERLESVLKNIGTISKRTERNGNCLKRTVKIVNAFLFSRTRSKLRTHFKSVMCFSSDFLCM